jgi:hypothetical protein
MGMATASLAQTVVPAPAPAPVKTWADSVTVKGDIRYRYETRDDKSALNAQKETYTRQLDRVRARLSAEAKCNDKTKAVVGLSTGQSDPISGNQTLGDGFAKKEMRLDLAYIEYTALSSGALDVKGVGGKMKNPFMTFQDDLIWDGDATPEGLALKAECGMGMATLMANGGYLWLLERSSRKDTMLYAGQAALKLEFIPEVSLTLGGSYYGFRNVKGENVIAWEGNNSSFGNSTVSGTVSGSTTNKAWATDFTPVVLFAQLELWLMGIPVNLTVQELTNGDADKLEKGHMYGIAIGKAKNPNTFEVGYSYAELEKDATLGALTDSDRWGGGTDGKGAKIYAKYQIMKNLQAAVTYFDDDKAIADPSKTKDYGRMQVDLIAGF